MLTFRLIGEPETIITYPDLINLWNINILFGKRDKFISVGAVTNARELDQILEIVLSLIDISPFARKC